ncbi:MFS transporter [Streptomyces sp. Q6]|uniref:MFS transporter n=2 Tax=Streptomyces citrinus TaxID=3118173 RepID=A0ACD5ALN4_9ACTN
MRERAPRSPKEPRGRFPRSRGSREARRSRSIWSRDFGLFFVARAIAKLGDTMLPVALAAGLLQYGYGAGAVGLAMAASVGCFAGLVIFGGVFADRFSTRLLMIGADATRLVSQSLAAVMFFTGHVVLWEICVIGAVNGAASAIFQPGVASTVPRLAADVQAANGAIRVAESGSQLAGPAVAGLLVAFASPGLVFAAHAGTYALSALCLILLRLPPAAPGTQAVRTRFRTELVDGWKEFRARQWLWGVIAVWCVLQIGASGPAVPLIATEITQEHGPRAYGLVNSALGAGTVIGGLVALRLRPRRMLRAGSLALFAFALFPAVVGAGLDVPWMMAGCLVAGTGMSFWGVMWATSVQTQVPHEVLNRIHAYDVAGSLAMAPVGQALAGPASGAFGTRHVLLAGGVVTLLSATALLAIPGVRNLVRADARPTPATLPVPRPEQEPARPGTRNR